jgi:uncharacterized protein (UPF0261 family)
MAPVALVGTLDTKGPDFAFLAGRLRAAGAEVIVVDAGTGEPNGLTPDIDGDAVAAAAGTTRAELREAADRGRAVTEMGRGAASVIADLVAQGRVGGVLAAGGSGGSSIAAQVMAGLPVGLPKLLVSTMASGDVSPYVGAKDVCIMHSVVDVAGLNRISRLVLGNAAAAMAGMVAAQEQAAQAAHAAPAADERPLVAASMFGVTTPAVETARGRLAELGYEVLVFHATGAGGRALEALAEARLVNGVLDLTTTELADDLVGGVLSAGPGRLTAAGAAGVPQVIAPGALDMVNFGPPATVPDRFSGRLFFEHNPTVTLMRTTAGEMAELGARIGRKAAAATGPTEVFWPERGVSALDADGQPFRDPAADEACREALDRELTAAGQSLRRMDAHINDAAFATAMADRLHEMITSTR